MFAVERQKRIIELLKENGVVSVSKLSVDLQVTEETIRRDLEKLEKQEVLLRTHGGAVPLDDSNHELSLEKRKNKNIEAKAKLAKEAVKLISAGDAVFIDASTTTFYLSKELKTAKNITVVTNSLRVLTELSSNHDIKLISVGGMVSNNQSLVGGIAETGIRQNYFVNKMFISSRGITKNGGVLESNEQECCIKQSIIENSAKRYYICDKTKIGRVGFAKLMGFDELDGIVTEKGALDAEFKNLLVENGVEIIEA